MTALTGLGSLIRLALRRDRILLPVWIVGIVSLGHAVFASFSAIYVDEAGRVAGAQFSAANPMTRVFDGPASGTELGAMTMVEAFKVLAILVALMSAQAVVRHTRQEEETGRAELIGSAVVGRHARLVAALCVTLGANLVLGAGLVAALVANDLALSGALAAGMAVAGVGWAFAGIAAVAAQVFSTARGANAVAGAALGIAFVLRAVGDLLGEVEPSRVAVVSAWPSWVSPLGWGQQVRPFYQDNWWIGGLFGAFTLLAVALAFWLNVRRDVGAGLVTARPGPARATRALQSAFGLAWRLQRTILLAWTVGLVVSGAAFGAVGDSLEEIVTENEQFAQLLAQVSPGAAIVDLYFTFTMAFLGIAAGAYTVQALLRMRSEEASGRLEPILARAVDRRRWLVGHVLIAAFGTTLMLTLSGAAGGMIHGAITGRWAEGAGLAEAGLAQIPAALALGGFVVAIFAFTPRWAGALAWAALAAGLVMSQLGELLELPQWLMDVSPFTHVPRVPAEDFSALPVLLLLGAALALGAVGFAAFRRRDLVIGA